MPSVLHGTWNLESPIRWLFISTRSMVSLLARPQRNCSFTNNNNYPLLHLEGKVPSLAQKQFFMDQNLASLTKMRCLKIWLVRNNQIFNVSIYSPLIVAAKEKALLQEAMVLIILSSLTNPCSLGTYLFRDINKNPACPFNNPGWRIQDPDAILQGWWRNQNQGKASIFFLLCFKRKSWDCRSWCCDLFSRRTKKRHLQLGIRKANKQLRWNSRAIKILSDCTRKWLQRNTSFWRFINLDKDTKLEWSL